MKENLHSQRKVTLKAYLISATSSIKFASYFTVLWKSKDSSISTQSSKCEVKQGQATFNQTLTLQVSVPFDQVSKKYLKYQTQMNLRLISKAKQHQQAKLVGKINLQISTILNYPEKQGVKLQYPLQFCSVNAVLSLHFEVVYSHNTQQIIQAKVNATPPKSPPTLAFIKSKGSQQHLQEEKIQKKVSLSSLRRSTVQQRSNQSQKHCISVSSQNKIKEEFEQLKRLNIQLSKQKQIVQNNLSQCLQSLKFLENELEFNKKQNQRLREQVRKKLDQNVKMQLEMSEVRQLNTQKTLQIAANSRQSNKLSILNQQLDKAENEKKLLTTQVKELQKAHLQLRMEKSNYDSQLRKAKNELLAQNSQLASSFQNIHLLQETNKTLKLQFSQCQALLRSQIQQQKLLNSELQERVKTLQAQVTFSDQKSLEFEATRIARQQYISHLQAVNADREERINQLESTLLISEEQLKTLRQDKTSLQLLIAQKQNEFNQLIFQKGRTELMANTKILNVQQSLQQLRVQKDNVQEQLRLLVSQKQHELIICKNENILLKQEVATLKKNCEQIQNYKAKIAELQEILLISNEIKAKQLQEAESNHRQAERKMRDIQHQNKSLQHSYKTSQERMLVYQKEIHERENLIERLQEGLGKQMKINQDKNHQLIEVLQKTQSHSYTVATLQRELTALNQLLSLIEMNERKYKNKIGDLELQLYQLLTPHQCLEKKYREVESKYRELEIRQQKKCLQDSQTIYQIQTLLELQRSTSRELEQRLRIVEAELKVTLAHLHELEKQQSQLLKDIKLMKHTASQQKRLRKNQQEQNRKNLDKLHSQIERLNQKLRIQEQQINEKDNRLLTITAGKSSIENELQTVQQSKEQLLANILKLQTQLNQQIHSLTQQAENKSNEMRVQLQKEMRKCEELEELLKLSNEQKQAEQEHYQRSILENQHKASKQAEEIINYKQQLQSHSAQITNLKSSINILQVQVQNFNQQILKKQTQIESHHSKQNQLSKCQYLQTIIQQRDQQIAQLQQEIDRISGEANQVYDLIEQVEAYRQELQLHEEERANIQISEKQRNTEMAELRQEKSRLQEEIISLTQKINQLEVNLYLLEQSRQEKIETNCELLNMQKAVQQQVECPDEDLRLEIADLRLRIKDLEDKNDALQAELDDKQEKHVVDLIDQHIRLSKPECSDNNMARSNSRIGKQALPDFVQTCQTLKQILKNRQSLSLVSEKDESLASKPLLEDIPRYSRTVSLELQKMKAQLLKGDRRSNVSELFKNCENSIKSLCAFVQECCSYQ